MNRIHLVELPSGRPLARQTVPQADAAPICIDCANGYHEQLLTGDCSCPCHGDPISVKCEVAA
jgi:hypothetical protein